MQAASGFSIWVQAGIMANVSNGKQTLCLVMCPAMTRTKHSLLSRSGNHSFLGDAIYIVSRARKRRKCSFPVNGFPAAFSSTLSCVVTIGHVSRSVIPTAIITVSLQRYACIYSSDNVTQSIFPRTAVISSKTSVLFGNYRVATFTSSANSSIALCRQKISSVSLLALKQEYKNRYLPDSEIGIFFFPIPVRHRSINKMIMCCPYF